MSDQFIRLTYPSGLLKVPVINQLIRRYDLTVNILKAQIDSDQGWIEVQLAGNAIVVEEALAWLQSQGINVEQINEG